MSAERIRAYFSHSYRHEDREVNDFFWRLLWARGLTLTVDPESESLSIPYLEFMMRHSAAFVGVVTRRVEQRVFQCSPFMVYEYGLAVQARKPRLVFVESGVSDYSFPERGEVVYFSRDKLRLVKAEAEAKIDTLIRRSDASALTGARPLGSVGLFVGDHIRGDVIDVVRGHGFVPVELNAEAQDQFRLAMHLDGLDFVIIEPADQRLPYWLLPYLGGRFTPMIQLVRDHDPVGGLGLFRPWETSELLDTIATATERLVHYGDAKELRAGLAPHLARIREDRTTFTSLEDGFRYLRNLGRRRARIFVSNSSDANEVGAELSSLLRRENLPHFHYRFHNDIELADNWRERLPDRICASQYFVALITDGYWQSEYCMEEYALARELADEGKIEIIPYLLQGSRSTSIPENGRDLSGIPHGRRARRIVDDLDGKLTTRERKQMQVAYGGDAARQSDFAETPVDVAFITVIREEYSAVLRHLGAYQQDPGSVRLPNMHSWVHASLASPNRSRPFHVVLGLAARPGSDAGGQAVTNAIQCFDPAVVLLVGIAGGLRDVRLGDVVVSDRIWGYEYGKIDDKYEPRPDWNLPADGSIFAAASTFADRHPGWHSSITSAPPSLSGPPAVHIGPVASGDKVIDNLSDPYFQEVQRAWKRLIAVEMEGIGAISAIQNARDIGHRVGFMMIRGISDLPRSAESASSHDGGTLQRDSWKAYAAESAAVFAVELVKRSWPRVPREP